MNRVKVRNMEGRVYISAKEEVKKKIRQAMAKKHQIIYTDTLNDADYILIEKQPDGHLADAQFKSLMQAKESGIPVRFFKLGETHRLEQAKVSAMRQTRKNFDMEME